MFFFYHHKLYSLLSPPPQKDLKYIPNKNYVYKNFRGEKITVLGTQKNQRLRLCMESLCVLVPAKIKQLCSDQTGTANE